MSWFHPKSRLTGFSEMCAIPTHQEWAGIIWFVSALWLEAKRSRL